MWYLFFQMWLWILIAFVLGWVAHWFLCCRNKPCEKESDSSNVTINTTESINNLSNTNSAAAAITASSDTGLDDTFKPVGLSSAPSQADDLKQIKGIGAVNEKALNDLGIYTFSQIADWSPDNISWVEGFLSFPGRITREGWVEQARTLALGGATEFDPSFSAKVFQQKAARQKVIRHGKALL